MGFVLDRKDAVIIAVVLVISVIVGMASFLSPYPLRTDLVYALEGNIVAYLQPEPRPLLTVLFVGIYLLLYPAFLLGTYVGLKHRHGRGRPLDYAVTYSAVMVVSIPFFYFVPVGVTGYYLNDVHPVLYEFTGLLHHFMKNVDTLQKALPSLHTGLAATASLNAPDGYERLSWAITGLVVASTFYLGIHWVTDVVLGLALAFGCHHVLPDVHTLFENIRSEPEIRSLSDD